MDICVKNGDPVVAYAAAELGRCVRAMTGGDDASSVTLGLFADCGVEAPELGDASLDDAVHVRFSDGTGCIAGPNPRSVLLGVYRFLFELGCRWVRPGRKGEFIPRRNWRAPAYRSTSRPPTATASSASRAPSAWRTCWTWSSGCRRPASTGSTCSSRTDTSSSTAGIRTATTRPVSARSRSNAAWRASSRASSRERSRGAGCSTTPSATAGTRRRSACPASAGWRCTSCRRSSARRSPWWPAGATCSGASPC